MLPLLACERCGSNDIRALESPDVTACLCDRCGRYWTVPKPGLNDPHPNRRSPVVTAGATSAGTHCPKCLKPTAKSVKDLLTSADGEYFACIMCEEVWLVLAGSDRPLVDVFAPPEDRSAGSD